MATLAATNPTLLDFAQALDPDGSVATVVEILHETNEVMADWTFVEGNLPTGHRSVIRSGLPTPTWRRLYGGVQPNKSQRVQVTDTVGMLEAYNEVDKALADLNGNTNEFRLSEAVATIEGISQELVSTLFYGDTNVNPERFDGFSTRYNDLSAENADNIIDASGTGSDNASIWLVVWGPNTAHGIIPKGSTAGMQVTDKGQQTIEDADGSGSGGRMEAYRMHFRMDAGLTVRDWRYVVRICNIDKSLTLADAASGPNLPELMFEAMELIPPMGIGRPAFYMSRFIRQRFRQQLAAETSHSTLEYVNVGGHKSVVFNEIPLRRVDALSADEVRVM